jgi:hypothetical protein
MKRFKLMLFVLTTVFAFSSCTKNDKTTVVLVGKETYIPDIHDIIPDTLLTKFDFLPDGPIPPDVAGEFIADPYILSYSNISYDIVGQGRKSRYLRFSNQFNRFCTFDTKQGSETIHADTIYLTGINKFFTAYFFGYVEDNFYHTKSKTANVITGCVTDEGIKDLTYGWLLLEKFDPDTLLVPVGSMRIFKDEDKMSETFEWFQNKSMSNGTENTRSDLFINTYNNTNQE